MAGRMLCMITLLILSLESVQEQESQHILRQRHEDSCGFAAAASLLSCYWQIPVSEAHLISNHLETYSENTTAYLNISFSAMQGILSSYSIESHGFFIDIDDLGNLTDIYGPVICLDSRGSGHFYLLLCVISLCNEEVFIIADPDWGIAHLSRDSFSALYADRVLVSASAYASMSYAYRRNMEEALGAYTDFYNHWISTARP